MGEAREVNRLKISNSMKLKYFIRCVVCGAAKPVSKMGGGSPDFVVAAAWGMCIAKGASLLFCHGMRPKMGGGRPIGKGLLIDCI
jgi:hypothetical protein